MKTITQIFESAFEAKMNENWDKIYVMVDVHETFMKPDCTGMDTEFYPIALDVLRMMSDRKDICLIMWTCSSAEHREAYAKMCENYGVIFDYQNENPESGANFKLGGDYTSKMYANVILDDKAGFEHECDWFELYKYFEVDHRTNTFKNGELQQIVSEYKKSEE